MVAESSVRGIATTLSSPSIRENGIEDIQGSYAVPVQQHVGRAIPVSGSDFPLHQITVRKSVKIIVCLNHDRRLPTSRSHSVSRRIHHIDTVFFHNIV